MGPVDDPPRAGQPRGAGAAGPSAHLGRARAHRGRLPVLRRPSAPGRRARPRAVAVAGAQRDRRGDARHHRDAVAGHRPAGDRQRAADRDLDRPPHRGAGAAAPGADGGRDHLHRWRLQAAVHLPAAGRHRPRRLGGELPQRASGGPRARRPHAPPAAARPVAVRHRDRVPRRAGPGVHRPRGVGSGEPVRRRNRPAADGRADRRRVRAQPADGHARAPGRPARGAALGAHRPPRRRRADRRRERDAGAALAGARRRQLRAAPAQPRCGVGDRAAADGLRRAIRAVREAAAQLSTFVADVYDTR